MCVSVLFNSLLGYFDVKTHVIWEGFVTMREMQTNHIRSLGLGS